MTTSVVCCVIDYTGSSSSTNTVQTFLLVYKAPRCLAPQYLADFCQPVSAVSGSKRPAIVHVQWPRHRLNYSILWTAFLRCVCTIGVEPASSRHQEPSVAEVVHLICSATVTDTDTDTHDTDTDAAFADSSRPCSGSAPCYGLLEIVGFIIIIIIII